MAQTLSKWTTPVISVERTLELRACRPRQSNQRMETEIEGGAVQRAVTER